MSEKYATPEQMAQLAKNLDKVIEILDNLTPEQQEKFEKGLRERGITEEQLEQAMEKMDSLNQNKIAPKNQNKPLLENQNKSCLLI